MPDLPLKGIRILETSDILALPTAMSIMADMGAEVIHVEYAQRPNFYRFLGPYPESRPGPNWHDRSAAFNASNRSKLSLTLNLGSPKGKDVFLKLVEVSDVVAENFSARVMGNFGLDYPALKGVKSDIIMLSNTGYGHSGPWRDYVGMAQVIEAATTAHLTGYPDRLPGKAGQSIMDLVVAWNIVNAIMLALLHRGRTGKAQWIDHSMLQACVPLAIGPLMDAAMNPAKRDNQMRRGNRDAVHAPQGCYPCTGDDDWLVISVTSNEEWRKLVAAIGNPAWTQDARLATEAGRMAAHDELDRHISAWTSGQDKMQAMELLQNAGVPAGAVLKNKEVLANPQYQERGFWEMANHPPETGIGGRLYGGRPFRMSRTNGRIRRATAPLAYDNRYILEELLGLEEDEVLDMEDEGVASPYLTGPEVGDMRVGNMPAGYRPAAPTGQGLVERGDAHSYDPSYNETLGQKASGSATSKGRMPVEE
ncbi:MAG: CoA transferase [Chloroflexi bacterium]|nr:CoA transferase [Chloroflexota bacterium]